jgi:flagellar hook-associated protein 1 FlgK
MQAGPVVGNGVDVSSITQSRDSFLDARYRNQNAVYQQWQTESDNLSQVEDIFNEFSSTDDITGISGQLNNLTSNLQSYMTSPTNANLPITIMNSFDTECQTVKTDYTQLNDFMSQSKGDLSTIVDGGDGGNGKGGVNAILTNIQSLNKEIASYELRGQKANDMRDQRNNLLDQLSGEMDITVNEQTNGMVTVALQNDSHEMLVGADNSINTIKMNSDDTAVQWQDGTDVNIQGGSVKGYLNLINGDGSGTGDYGNIGLKYMTQKLNDFATAFAATANSNVPTGGKPLIQLSDSDNPAAGIDLSDDWKSDKSLFAENYTGSDTTSYISKYVNAFSSDKLNAGGVTYDGTLMDYADSVSGDLANDLNYDKQMADSNSSMLDDMNNQRLAISSVSIDEEGVNIIKYTQAYNASARVITAIDDMLDKLINGTGEVGR